MTLKVHYKIESTLNNESVYEYDGDKWRLKRLAKVQADLTANQALKRELLEKFEQAVDRALFLQTPTLEPLSDEGKNSFLQDLP